MAALLLLFVIGLIGVAAATGWEETWAQLKKLTALQIIGLLALSLINYILRGVRWHMLSTKLGTGLPLRFNVLHFVAGFAMTITPGRLGELVRLRWISKLTSRSLTSIAPLPLVDRAFDMAAMGVVLAGGVALSQTGTTGAIPVALLAIATAFIVTRPALLGWLITYAHKALGRWSRFFGRARQAARSMQVFGTPGLAIPALTLSIIGWLAEGVALYMLLTWLGADISLAAATVIFIFSTLAGGLTGAPGGIGGAEAAMIFLLSLNGVPMEISLPATAVIRVTTLWFAIVIGLLTFPLAERLSRRPLHKA